MTDTKDKIVNKKNKTPSVVKQGIAVDQLRKMIASSPFASVLNTQVGDCGEGYAEIHLPITDVTKQHSGVVNGAVIGFIADTACCIAAGTKFGDVLTQEYKVNFIAPAFGDELVAKGSVIGSTFSQVVARADVYARRDKKDYLVATALATLFVV